MNEDEIKNQIPQLKISPGGAVKGKTEETDPDAIEFCAHLYGSLDAFYKAYAIMRRKTHDPKFKQGASVTLRTMKTLIESVE